MAWHFSEWVGLERPRLAGRGSAGEGKDIWARHVLGGGGKYWQVMLRLGVARQGFHGDARIGRVCLCGVMQGKDFAAPQAAVWQG